MRTEDASLDKKVKGRSRSRKLHAKRKRSFQKGLVNSIKKQRLALKAGRGDLTRQRGKTKTQWCLESWKQKTENR